MDFSRHWLFINDEIQQKLSEKQILVAGVGIGSIFAELAVRTGVNRLIIADGDNIEIHNLTRQNYTHADLGQNKAEILGKRLRQINPDAEILVHPHFLTATTLAQYIKQVDFVVNTIDFECPAHITCSRLCRELEKIEFFPFNLGFASTLSIFAPSSPTWDNFFKYNCPEDLKLQIIAYMTGSQGVETYTKKLAQEFRDLKNARPPHDPQLCLSSYMTAALIMTRIISIIAGEDFDTFPKFYYIDAKFPAIIGNPLSLRCK